MQFKNTPKSYGEIHKFLHWAVAIIFGYMFYLGLTMTGMENSPEKWAMYGEHKQWGVLVFMIVLLRFLWVIFNPKVELMDDKKSKIFMAKTMHLFLYAIMLLYPLTGYVMSMAGGHGIVFFGMDVYNLFNVENKEVAGIAKQIHNLLVPITLTAIALHVIAVFHHYVSGKKEIVKRMAPLVNNEDK